MRKYQTEGYKRLPRKKKEVWDSQTYNEKIGHLQYSNWYLSKREKAICKIYRRRSKHVAENGKSILGEIIREADGWIWKDLSGNRSTEHLSSKPNALLSFVLSRKWQSGNM